MKIRNIALALLTSIPLLACSQPAPPPAATSSNSDTSKGFIGEQVDKALDKARKELREGNISLSGDFNINVNGKQITRPANGLPKAEITPTGELRIAGKPVAVSPEQRQQLLAYRGQIIGIAEAGMAIGSQGADLAGKAVGGVMGAIFGGEKGQQDFEAKMEAEGKKIEAQAMKLCVRLPALMASQQQLADSLPAFKPYATMTQEDIEDCGKRHAKDNGVAVTSG